MVKQQEKFEEQSIGKPVEADDCIRCEDSPVKLVFDPQGGELRDRLKSYFLREKSHGSYQKSE